MRIMVIEDNPADRLLLQEVAAETDAALCLSFADRGDHALVTLRHVMATRPEALPHLILLDLGLPGLTGFDVLRSLKDTPGLQLIPVVVFSTSTLRETIERAYRAQASAFITKPSDYTGFQAVFAASVGFWKASVFPRVAAPVGS